MRLTIRLLIASLLLTSATALWAQGSAEAGATKAATCLACHGVNGNSVNSVWPNLAGQNVAYLSKQLHHYHSGSRNGMEKDKTGTMLMPPMAATLSDQDIDDIAAYYSLQTPTGGEADPAYVDAGRKLYHGGDRARQIPACAACHGPLGSGNPAAGYPSLRAQHADYTLKQLGMYHDKARYTVNAKGATMGGDNADIMHTIVSRLSTDDLRNLAQYIQGMR